MSTSIARQNPGFTLLEMMITLCIAGVIATFAVPAYTQHLARGHRMDAVAALYRAAQQVETMRSVSGENMTKLPAGSDQAPLQGTATYMLSMLAATDINGGYAIEATPASIDECGVFTLDATGARSNRSGAEKLTPLKVAACWGSR